MRRRESTANVEVARPLRQGQGWSNSEYICTAGPDDRPFEEQSEQFSIAAVIEALSAGADPTTLSVRWCDDRSQSKDRP
jgi:hypothetical protein